MAGNAIEFERGSKICGKLLWGHVKARSCVFHRCIFYMGLKLKGSGNVINYGVFLETTQRWRIDYGPRN